MQSRASVGPRTPVGVPYNGDSDMSRRRRKNKNGLSGKERNVYKQRRETATHTKRSVEDFHFEFDKKPDQSRDVPIRSRNDFLPSAESQASATSPSYASPNDNQLTFSVPSMTPAVMRIVKDEDHQPAQTTTNRWQANQHNPSQSSDTSAETRRTFTWRGYLQGCAWGGAAAATILAALRIAS